MRWRGGGHKRRYRIVDFKRRKFDMTATVERLEYDPNRTAFIALISYDDGEQAYILAPQRLQAGDKVVSGERVDVKPGNAMPLKNIPVGTIVHNVELKPGRGGQIARARPAPTVQLVGRDAGLRPAAHGLGRGAHGAHASAWRRSARSPTPISRTSTSARPAAIAGWAGSPSVRGVAMNPIDHPHGGGEGRTSGGRHPVTPWGKPTKGKKTRHNKKTDGMIMRRRRVGK